MSTLTDIEDRYTFVLHNPIFRDDWYVIGQCKSVEDIYPKYLDEYFKVPFKIIFCIKSFQHFSSDNEIFMALDTEGYKPIDLINGCKLYNISQSNLIGLVVSTCRKSNSYKVIEDNSKIDFLDIKHEIERITDISNSFRWYLQDEEYNNMLSQDFGDTTPYYLFDDDFSESENSVSKECSEMDDIKEKLFQVRDYYENVERDVDSYMTLAVMDLWKAFLVRRKSLEI